MARKSLVPAPRALRHPRYIDRNDGIEIKFRRLSAGHYQCRDYPTIFVDLYPSEELPGEFADIWLIVVDDEIVDGAETLCDARHKISYFWAPRIGWLRALETENI